jgi:transketolase C-terminal domain/subunit
MALPRNVHRIKGDVEASVDAAIAQMTWLKPSDYALVTLALKYAREMDSETDNHRTIGYLGQQLHIVLKSLGGAPLERRALASEEGGGGRLSELRKARAERERRAKDLDSASSGVDS